MRIYLFSAYFTLAMVSFISSCLFVLLVASESTKIQQNLNNDKNDEIKGNLKYINNEKFNNKYSNLDKIKYENKLNKKNSENTENPDENINTNNLVFLENLSKNSGITENEFVTLLDKPKVLIENILKENILETKQNYSKDSVSYENVDDENLNSDNDERIGENVIGSSSDSENKISNNIPNEEYIVIAEPKIGNLENNKNIESTLLLNDPGGDIEFQTSDNEGVIKPEISDSLLNNTNVNITEETQIPVYSEWAQKHIEESEKLEQGSIPNSSTTKKNETSKKLNVKLRAKNYASPDCGAKIIASNSDAQSTSSVLTSSKDEYMLNPCQSRIWFVVELCEPIRAEKIELANFELFSSSPKQFSVGVSNRYPTRDWSIVGQFTARDERDIQKFKLHPHLFGKFVKVEVHSHYSSEHFCPISLFSVYGTSEFEAFATENEIINHSHGYNDEDDDDETLLDDDGHGQQNIKKSGNQNYLKSASDAVISMVKKVGEVLSKKTEDKSSNNNINRNQIGYTKNFTISCTDCDENLLKMVENDIEYKQNDIRKLLKQPKSNLFDILYKSSICSDYLNNFKNSNHIIVSLLTKHYTIAVCNILKNLNLINCETEINEMNLDKKFIDFNSKILMNENKETNLDYNSLNIDRNIKNNSEVPCDASNASTHDQEINENPNASNLSENKESHLENIIEKSIDDDTIEPTATDFKDIHLETSLERPPLLDESIDDVLLVPKTTISSSMDVNSETMDKNEDVLHLTEQTMSIIVTQTQNVITTPTPIPQNAPKLDVEKIENIENLDTENIQDKSGENENQAVPLSVQKGQTDSVFLRLSSRIKSLERNLSLSEQYLEELSRRYKKQVEELQQSFSKLLLTIEDQNRRNNEREQNLLETNLKLREDLDELSDKMNSWYNFYFFGFITFEILLITIIMKLCGRGSVNRIRGNDSVINHNISQLNQDQINCKNASCINENERKQLLQQYLRRRNSLENLNNTLNYNMNSGMRRRLSEEALQTYGTYGNLLVDSRNSDDIEVINFMDEINEYNNDKSSNNNNNNKKGKNRQRKTSNPNQKRALSVEPSKSQNKIKLFRNESAPVGVQHNGNSINNSCVNYKNYPIKESTLLDENDEIYMPNMDLALNEFMPDGPSFHKNSSSTPISLLKEKFKSSSSKSQKTRRLSSPAFFKSALSRNGISLRKSPSPIEENRTTIATSWEFLNKKSNNTNNSSQELINKNHSNGKKLNNLISGKHNKLKKDHFIIPLNKLNSDVLNDKSSSGGLSSSNSSNTSSGGSFKKLFKKVF